MATLRLLLLTVGVVALLVAPLPIAAAPDAYDVLMQSAAWSEQRAAFATIAAAPRPFLPRLRRSLREYPQLISSHPQEALRAVTLASYLRDVAFAGILLDSLQDADVEARCEHPDPLVLAFTVHAAFGSWQPPLTLNPGLPCVRAFQAELERLPGSRGQAPRPPVAGASTAHAQRERQLIAQAGPATADRATRLAAAKALASSVTTGTNRRDLYLLAMNDLPEDPEREYLGAVYAAIYRAEMALR